MDFGKVLTRSWEIIWKNKILWLFGILASCGAQNQFGGSSFNFSFDSSNAGDMPRGMQEFFYSMERTFSNIDIPEESIVLFVFGMICVGLIIGLIAFLISVYGRVGLIKGAVNAEAGQTLEFGTLASEAGSYYGRALGLNILLGLLVLAVGLLVGLFFAACGILTLGIGVLCLLPLLCLFIPLGLAYTVYSEFANVALISEDLSVGDALRRGWDVLRENVANVALMAIILFIGGAVVSFLVSLPFALIGVPALIGAFSDTQAGFTTGIVTSLVALCFAIPVMLVVAGVLRSYLQSAWTLTYLQVAGKDS